MPSELISSLRKDNRSRQSSYTTVTRLLIEGSGNPRTAIEMDGTLHTDFRKSETSRDIKKYF